MLTSFLPYVKSQSVWGKDINTTHSEFATFLKEKGYRKNYIDKERCFCTYSNVEFAGQKFDLNIFYSAKNDSIKELYFAKSDTRPKIFRDDRIYSAKYTLLLSKYKNKYPEGKEIDQNTWICKLPNGGSICLSMSKDKSGIGIIYYSCYKEKVQIEKIDKDI